MHMLPKLNSLLDKYNFSAEEQELINQHFKIITLKRKSYFLKAGDVANKIAFIEDGAFEYHLFNDGEKITTFILLDHSMITSISSYLKETASIENIQAITDSTIAIISKASIEKLRNTIPKFQKLYIDTIEHQILCLDNNRTDLLTSTPKQRYLKLLKSQPELFAKIPLKLLATTLGITPRHLTRIRSNIVN